MNHEAMRGPGADGDERRLIFSSMSTFAGAQEKTMNRYVRMAANASNTLSNDDIIKIIFDKRYEETRTGIIGNIDEKEFNRKFGAGISSYESFDERLKGIFLNKSFPETYFHPRIATVLCSTNKLTTEPPAQKRIKETGEIVLSAITSETPLAMMLAIASSHKLRNINVTNSPNYNAETVEFTLLTFSYFGATA